jgi:hypothetical protein
MALALVMLLGVSAVTRAEDLGIGAAKIAILTGTTTQGEEEFRAAEALKAKYPDNVVTATYPDNFSSEVETTIGTLISLATDPDVKAIIFCQGVAGASAGFQQIREIRPDILLITGVVGENPDVISAQADIVMNVDDTGSGIQIIDIIKGWDADVFVHYSFARHLSYDTIATRLKIFKKICEEYGIELVERDAPDPTGEAGMTGAQQFILEDVPIVMNEFAGKKVAFFSTNCGMQEALQIAILAQPNALYPMPCCPSPFHGFMASLSIAVEEADWGDFNNYLSKTAAALAERGAIDRFSTWPVPVNMGMINGGFEYALDWIKGGCEGDRSDMAKLKECLEKVSGSELKLSNWVMGDGAVLDNVFLILIGNVNYNEYLS